jgi:carbamoyltransferase
MIIINNVKEAVDILLEQKPLVIFQNHSEWGPRALGNRSILFDPTNKDAKNIVNNFKKREWWRPLAGTILLEHVHEWFDIATLKESPHMSFAVDAKQQAIEKIPSIVHVDNTCRIQTVTKEQNLNYYNLILEFYKKTGVPILLNTSFNLAKFPIVETLERAKYVCSVSDFNYLYLPEQLYIST